ncbi:hypothetical protein MMC24_003397 [Lignoscripta atroalba]|nr:hypothetical protein [Lignoscripta atroalba]
MFLLPWGTGARSEKVTTGKDKLLAAEQQMPPVTDASFSNKMKRKRRDSEDTVTSLEIRDLSRKRPGFMSHVEVPTTRKDNADRSGNGNESGVPKDSQPVSNEQSGEAREMEMDWEQTKDEAESRAVLPISGMSRPRRAKKYACQRRTADASTMTPVQQAIETQFSLEILLKHNELRLIDQELAKCQVALEQLSRCQVIPYPATSSRYEDLQAVSSGSGSAFGARSGGNQTHSRTPWGVADGPYTRHYAKWLIPDSAFDGNLIEEVRTPRSAGKKIPERSTRGSMAEKGSTATNSRSQRGMNGFRLQSLPAGYPEPKEEKGPMIVRRSTDGQMVKLVCLDCRRDNFNSAQGFINHCRIAHSRGFASHDAAAIACGEEVELNESGGVVGDQSGGSSASVGLVHPLVRSAHLARNTVATPTSSASRRKKPHQRTESSSQPSEQSHRGLDESSFTGLGTTSPQAEKPVDLPFTPSLETPHLSALFSKSGRGGDLSEMVSQAKTKSTMVEYSSEEEDDDHEMEDAPQLDNPHHLGFHGAPHGGRLPKRATMSPAPLERPVSSKGVDKHSRKPEYLDNIIARNTYSSPYAASNVRTNQHSPEEGSNAATVLLEHSPALNLSPNTIESNPAPSLVSDDGDCENAPSESETPSLAGDDEEDRYLDIEVEDEEVGDPSVDPELATAAKAHPTRRSSALRSPTAIRGGHVERHVSFASPARRERRRRGSK